ncbi:MAG: HAD family hydrolase [Candidatus Hodarchaeota archaeon]
MVDFESITTLLFDIDNTLLIFDEPRFRSIYSKLIHKYFQKEMPDLNHFVKIFLESIYNIMKSNHPSHTILSRFELEFSKHLETLTASIIQERFLQFYQNEYNQLSQIIKPNPFAKSLLTLAAKHFTLVAATNPFFPLIANEFRLKWGGIGRNNIRWDEITSSDYYHSAKPHIEYYQEILNRLNKKPNECLMIGNDPNNDMSAGKIGIKTFLVVSYGDLDNKISPTSLDQEKAKYPINFFGTLEDFYKLMKQFIHSKGI